MAKAEKAFILAFKIKINFQTVAFYYSIYKDSCWGLFLSGWQRWNAFLTDFCNVDYIWFMKDQSVFNQFWIWAPNFENSLRAAAALWAADRIAWKQKCLELEEKQKRRK